MKNALNLMNLTSLAIGKKGKENEEININGKQFKLATMNRRLIASVLDTVFMLFFFSPILNYITYLVVYNKQTPTQILEKFQDQSTVDMTSMAGVLNSFVSYLRDNDMLMKYLFVQLVALILFGIFMVGFWKWKGATPGKMIARCEVIDADNGNTPTIKQSLIRFIGYIISSIPLGLGFIIISFTKKRQGLHDKIANTIVVVKPWKSKT